MWCSWDSAHGFPRRPAALACGRRRSIFPRSRSRRSGESEETCGNQKALAIWFPSRSLIGDMQSIRRSSRRLAWLALGRDGVSPSWRDAPRHACDWRRTRRRGLSDPHVRLPRRSLRRSSRAGPREHPTEQVHCPACALAKIASPSPRHRSRPPRPPRSPSSRCEPPAAHQPAHASRHRDRGPPHSAPPPLSEDAVPRRRHLTVFIGDRHQ